MRRRQGRVHVLDDVDRQIVEILRDNPRTSNRLIAKRVGITDETVAARLRRMTDGGAMAMTARLDWQAAGYGARAWARARFPGGSIVEALKPLFDVPEVFSAAEMIGCADAAIALLAPDIDGIDRLLTDHIRPLERLTDLRVDVVSEVLKCNNYMASLPITAWSPELLPAPVVRLDELDMRLLREVAGDGHASDRELARRLDVSDGTVRARLMRMQSAGLLRVAALVDPVTTEEVGAMANLWISLDGDPDETIALLVEDPFSWHIERCLGSADAVVVVVTPTADELIDHIARVIRNLPGVRSVDVGVVTDIRLHRAHLTRFI